MIRALSLLWRQNRLLVLAFALAAALTLVFAVRMTLDVALWNDPMRRDQPIEGWMTPRYVAMSWDVPPEVMARALDLPAPPPRAGRRRALRDIAADREMPLQALIDEVEAAIAAHRSETRGMGGE